MKIVYFICTFCILYSCNNKLSKKTKECSTYIETIKENWKKNEQGIYPISNKEILWNDNQKCLISKSKNEILSIFGEPSIKGENKESGINSFGYYLDEGCLRGKDGDCVIFTLHFDKEDKVSFIPLAIIQPKN